MPVTIATKVARGFFMPKTGMGMKSPGGAFAVLLVERAELAVGHDEIARLTFAGHRKVRQNFHPLEPGGNFLLFPAEPPECTFLNERHGFLFHPPVGVGADQIDIACWQERG